MNKNAFFSGPDPTGELTALPNPLAGLLGLFVREAEEALTSKGTGKEGREGRDSPWWSGVVVSALASINEVNQRRARLLLRWVTVSGFNSRWGTFISVCDQPPRSTQPGHPFVGRRNEFTSQMAVMPCGWRVKAGMVRVWVAGKTVRSLCYMRAISERFRDKELIIKRYIN